MKIGFIGLGNMGGGMAANLVRAGHEVHAFDLAPAALDHARAAGCSIAPDARAAVHQAEAVITMLTNGPVVSAVYEQEVIGHAPAHALLVDCSTIDVAAARHVAGLAQGAGYRMVDAPVSGGIAGAQAGTLTFMVGGPQDAFAAAAPLLHAMGKAVVHAGEAGAGQAVKICNNLLLGASMVATCEAFRLAERLGLDLQTFFDIASQASGQCWSMTTYCPVPGVGPVTPADRDYQGGFASALMLKDLRLALAAAQAAGAHVPMGQRAEELYAAFAQSGHGQEDFSAIIRSL
jgi:3-hydroxyisobutyrate dehydrogenase